MKTKATEAVKYIESESHFEENENAREVVDIAVAIRATQIAELEALQFALKVEKTTIENRISTLKDKLK